VKPSSGHHDFIFEIIQVVYYMIKMEQINTVRKFHLARSFLGRGLYFTAAYWVDGMMVDTGCAYTVQELLTSLKGYQIDYIVSTHSHEDHIAGNAALQNIYGADVMAHPLALPVLSDPRGRQSLALYQRLMWGYPDPSKGKAIGEFVQTKNHRFTVIHTPGHSPDHICLYEPKEGWLFSGDLFVGGQDRALRADYNIWRIIESLEKVAVMDISILFPGSGNIRKNPHNEIIGKIEYLKELGERILSHYRQGLSYSQIRRKLLGPEIAIAYVTLGHFSGTNLIRSFIEDQPHMNDTKEGTE
jgi:glyoxylase-like metal-dependent hydrolase (beta-lactamase superfamily II)